MPWQAFFFRTEGGDEPVRRFLSDEVTPEERAAFMHRLKILDAKGASFLAAGKDVIEKVGDGLYELKVKGKRHNPRIILCFLEGGRMVFLDGFKKPYQRLKPNDLDVAVRRLRKLREGHEPGSPWPDPTTPPTN